MNALKLVVVKTNGGWPNIISSNIFNFISFKEGRFYNNFLVDKRFLNLVFN